MKKSSGAEIEEGPSGTDMGKRGRIICDTFLRYKGLERPVVIVADVKTETERHGVRMNIGVGRAFGALRAVVSKNELQRDAVLSRVVDVAAGKA